MRLFVAGMTESETSLGWDDTDSRCWDDTEVDYSIRGWDDTE